MMPAMNSEARYAMTKASRAWAYSWRSGATDETQNQHAAHMITRTAVFGPFRAGRSMAPIATATKATMSNSMGHGPYHNPFVASSLEWGGKGALNRPAAKQPLLQYATRYADSLGPLRPGESFSPVLNPNGDATIVRLLGWRGPAAIARLVITVVVAAVDRHAGGSPPHIGEKVFERHPSSADPDSPTAIQLEGIVGGRDAAIDHALPDVALSTVGISGLEASARFRAFVLEVVALNGSPGAAVASAHPHQMAGATVLSAVNDNQSAVSTARQIFKSTHSVSIAEQLEWR